jgi:hypothetical protein
MALMALMACASGAPGAPGAPRSNPNRIERTQIESEGPSSAYDLVQKLRPNWLRWRGSTSFTQQTDVAVYLDGVHLGGPEELRAITTTNLEFLEYLDARMATNRFGSGHVNGAILAVTRR